MGQAERSAPSPAQRSAAGSVRTADPNGRPAVQGQSALQYRSLGVPSDWYLDPADPQAGDRYERGAWESLEEKATAFLADHEAQETGPGSSTNPAVSPLQLVVEPVGTATQPVWIGLPSRGTGFGDTDFSDDGELGWQTDALCAQTDPEAFFPEKGGSTRDAKKVCGSCNVQAQCLEYALANDERFGIWGGLSERERRRLRKRAV
ncbi:WhiB family transcriptional regulator [Arthrobacter sp. H14-L1]|uniref:WhiB family transcriptional regulator n=1 Tax=Arthrobacter sp. H14-L1 TaxID=2996697 RepID=UPI00226F59C3|nr:WhiB family transcriptional regulator [Arthrobacter sp. H14-L1]MCY0904936.1 WhiB family transcriptional regulator [Arthrobacter sp. H14-L1]